MTTQAQPVMSTFTAPRPAQSVATLAKLVATQAVVGLLTAGIIALLYSPLAGASALSGALVCVIPGLFFAAFISAGMLAGLVPRLQLHSFYVGELLKLALTVALFTVLFTTVSTLQPLFVFVGFIVTQMAMMAGLLRG